ncbi:MULTISPECIES: hercynine metabolism small protein [unclassified Prochlorococcus]|uniref:hercynine metabolism small protein n=1 Tax=unclassified Prochlorococcus TaxID=2627481 RepID=UPI000533A12D|nr:MULTISPECIES: hercynine metabolism small protein [unclassified Prochlorococcus]KGG14609.1 hypothetical protein EV06_1667 [Prochlorococcus sp. MIT 0602]KGG15964.1 hypothetical protein EV07_1931 [Prochlorococcus sp. MIT 0603]
MDKIEKRLRLKMQREKLIKSLEEVYKNAFDQLTRLEIEDQSIAKLSQAFLLSRQAALNHLKIEIERPIITTPPCIDSIQENVSDP